MPDRAPRAFLSYTHIDDQGVDGRITTLREKLSVEVQIQTGRPFEIFQDVKDIQLGQSARELIDASLDEVTFLIPILTPSFFNSGPCREEVLRFLEHERRLGRNDLILPLYYVNHPPFNSLEEEDGDEVAAAMADHQWVDWRELRHESSTSATFGRKLESVALQIRDALNRIAASDGPAVNEPSVTPETGATSRGLSSQHPAMDRESPPDAQRSRGETREPAREIEARGPAEKTEPTTWVVDQSGGEQFTTIGEAINAAGPGDRILVRPGVYREGLIIDKPLEIIGDGNVDEIVIEARGENALVFRATMGRVANLSLRQMGGGEWYGVDISQGRLALEDCDITSQAQACVAVHGGAIPSILRNRIHDGGRTGVFVYENGEGTIEDNDIFGNALAGVAVINGGNPTVRRNRIRDGKGPGVVVLNNGNGTLEENDILANAHAGVAVTDGSNPTLRRNRVNRNGYEAVWIYDGGGGTFEDNDLRDNAGGAWDISSDSRANVSRARNKLT